jgi:hypothetical protein
MSSLLRWVFKTVAGVAVMIAWWTFTGSEDDPNHETASSIPTTVWEGGGGRLAIEADTTTVAQMRVSFSERGEGNQRWLETHEDVGPGHHSWAIDVPNGVGGYVELGAVDPQPGDELSWTLAVNGETVDEQSEALEEPLQKGYAFFIQTYFDDYATADFEEGD